MPATTSMPAVKGEGVPPLVAALPMARRSRHTDEKTAAYVIANRTALIARCVVALSTAITVIIASGLTMLARANGSTDNRSCARLVATLMCSV